MESMCKCPEWKQVQAVRRRELSPVYESDRARWRCPGETGRAWGRCGCHVGEGALLALGGRGRGGCSTARHVRGSPHSAGQPGPECHSVAVETVG